MRVEVTTHPGHRECSATAQVAPHAHRFTVQAYSTSIAFGRTVPWSDPVYGPGLAQRRALRLAQRVPGVGGETPTVQLQAGLALWGQRWQGRTVEAALGAALDVAVEAGSPVVRWWSSKWLGRTERGWLAATGRDES